TKQIAELRLAVERAQVVEQELKEARQALLTLVHIEQQHARLQQRILGCREDAAAKRTLNAQLKKEMSELRARIDQLDELSVCPTCERSMDPGHKSELRTTLTQQGKQRADEFRAHEADYRSLEAQVKRDEEHLAELAALLSEREPHQRRV